MATRRAHRRSSPAVTRLTRLAATITLIAAVWGTPAAFAQAPAETSSQERAGQQGGAEQRGGAGQRMEMVARFQEAVHSLDLSPQQRETIDAAFDKARADFRAMLPELRNADPDTRRARVRDLLETLRADVAGTLTESQRAALLDKLDEAGLGGDATGRRRPAAGDSGKPGDTAKTDEAKPGSTASSGDSPANPPATPGARAGAAASFGPGARLPSIASV